MVDVIANNLMHVVKDGVRELTVLNDCHLSIKSGEKVVIRGASGAGKSTLLHILAGYIQPVSGNVLVNGQTYSEMNRRDLHQFRSKNIGMILQQPYFMPEMTVYENITLPLHILDMPIDQSTIIQAAAQMGLSETILSAYPHTLSGGERTRASILRALVHKPKVVFADEPTAALDAKRSHKIYDYLANSSIFEGITMVIVSHDQHMLKYFEHVYDLENGCLERAHEKFSG